MHLLIYLFSTGNNFSNLADGSRNLQTRHIGNTYGTDWKMLKQRILNIIKAYTCMKFYISPLTCTLTINNQKDRFGFVLLWQFNHLQNPDWKVCIVKRKYLSHSFDPKFLPAVQSAEKLLATTHLEEKWAVVTQSWKKLPATRH